MALFSRDSLIRLADDNIRKSLKSRDSLTEMRRIASSPESQNFDVFLCHSSLDARVIHGLMLRLENRGLRVYVDWVEDAQLDRSRVTSVTADLLRERLKNSTCLLYAASENAYNSKWTPWELGFADGLHGRAGIVPITQQATNSNHFQGQEYLGLYPYLADGPDLQIHGSQHNFVGFLAWLKEGAKPPR